jgi:hypothetical protein
MWKTAVEAGQKADPDTRDWPASGVGKIAWRLLASQLVVLAILALIAYVVVADDPNRKGA